jgi:ADP-heptose:LPS heptosyltransferase
MALEPAQSIALSLADKIIRLRNFAFPPGSVRERFYLFLIRPLMLLLVAQKAPQARVEIAPEIILRRPKLLRYEDVRRILIVKCDHIGDFFLSLHACAIVRAGFPNASITLLCGPWNRDIARASSLFDDVRCLSVFNRLSGAGGRAFDPGEIHALALPEFDVAIDLRCAPGTLFLQNHIRARFKAGFEQTPYLEASSDTDQTHPALDFALPVPSPSVAGRTNAARHVQALLATLTSGIVHLFQTSREMPPALADMLAIKSPVPLRRRGKGPLIGLNTRSGAPTKDWPLSHFIAMAKDLIAQLDATIVLFGTEYERDDGARFVAELGADRIDDRMGKIDLIHMPSVLQQLDLYIGLDSGMTHVVALSGRPVLCLHAGVAPIEGFGPVGPCVRVLKVSPLACAPCQLSSLDECEFDHRCMRIMTPERVVSEIKAISAEAVRQDSPAIA